MTQSVCPRPRYVFGTATDLDTDSPHANARGLCFQAPISDGHNSDRDGKRSASSAIRELLLRAIALVQAGRIRDAEADARLSFEMKLGYSPPAALIWGVFPLVDALVELAELDDAEAVLDRAGYLGDPPPGAQSAPLLLESRARLRLAQRRPADARADLLAAASRWDELGIRHPGLAAWRVTLGEALLAEDELGAACELAEEHLALADRLELPGPRGAGLRALARTVDRREAVVLLEQAVEMLAASPAQL